jgi:DNA repair exonuclease SbcCD ATPase subunit
LRGKYVELNDRKDAIERLGGKIRTFADKVDEVKTKLGENDSAYVKMFQDLQNLRRILVRRSEKWNEAKQALVRFADEIERARVIWEAGLAAAEAREQSGLTEDEFFAKLKTDTALDAIQDAYNQALGSLDSELLEDGITPALSAGVSNTINVTPSKSKINA